MSYNYSGKAFVPRKKREEKKLQIPEGFPPEFIPIFNEADENQKQAMIDEFNLLKAMEEEQQRMASFVPTKEDLINYSDDEESDDDDGKYQVINDVSTSRRNDVTQQLQNEKITIDKMDVLNFMQNVNKMRTIQNEKVKFSDGSKVVKKLAEELFMVNVQLSVVMEMSLYVNNQNRFEEYIVLLQLYLAWRYPDQFKINNQ